MAKFDAEMLKKHHFWFLFVFVLVGLILAWVGLFWEVPGTTLATKEEQIKKQEGLKGVQAKPRLMIAKLSEQVNELQARRVNMWRQAWNEQKDLYFWPTKRKTADSDPLNVLDPQRVFYLKEDSQGFTEKQLAVVANRKFGDDIPNTNAVRDQFRNADIYGAAYNKLIADLEPMQFRDSWENILKFVPKWGQMPTSEEVWLAMEDLWVQREILMRIHQVNVEASKFASTSDLGGALAGMAGGLQIEKPNARVFRSRIWQLDIQIVDEGNKRVLKGSLKNLTNRLQVLGVGNALRLNVWLNDPERSQPFPLEIEGVSVPSGKGTQKNPNPLPIKPTSAHEIPVDWSPRGLFRVEQIFDARTVPVKRIEHLEIGKLSDRNNNLPLRMAPFSETAAAKDPSTTTSGPGFGNPMGPEGPRPGGTEGSSESTAVLNGQTPQHKINRVRYIDVTGQLRRIPIGLVVVTDQTYMKDIVESIANTKMRFQTTQVEWTRFHSVLNYHSGSPSDPFFPGSSGGTMGERGGPGGPGPMFGSGYNSGGPDNTSQDQFSANLMELSVYGIISLYEKFDDPKGGTPKQSTTTSTTREPAAPTKEKEKDPKDNLPPTKEKEKDPKDNLPPSKEKEKDPKDKMPPLADPKLDPKEKGKAPAPPVNPKP